MDQILGNNLFRSLLLYLANVARSKTRGVGSCLGSCCESAFLALKQWLISAPVLAYADFSRPLHLEIDAIHKGL
ncbi:hypothetical protein SKAU_G00150970 [Synaphobranchus kaupii]|uniref:Reverse transcriptase/retrotransposon-derived protein RNase H-like domain-containing protein n=1 Tax=Synaphobranchus kaupii TaxID=118154 RepID=A0A9Q1FH27_SYNKA|nr:hypothetical protein SKAU_G00150970 [Synaphobranchus kaupii]